jgi:hypothetical protein
MTQLYETIPDIALSFGVPDIDQYSFRVVKYRVGHSTLTIEISVPERPIGMKYLRFEEVAYFQGPLFWLGKPFTSMTSIAISNIVKNLDRYSAIPLDLHPRLGGVLCNSRMDLEIRIIAGTYAIFDNLPMD